MDTAPHTTEHPLVTSIEPTASYDDDSYEAMVLQYVEKHHIVQYSLLPPEKVAQLYPDDSYEAMVLELVEEKHIAEYGLLLPTSTAVSYTAINVPAIDTSSGSSATEGTEVITIEDASDLPVSYHGHLLCNNLCTHPRYERPRSLTPSRSSPRRRWR